MKGLNLSGFNKTKEDQHTATMTHKSGHTITIFKGQLPAIQRKQIEKLPIQNFDEGTGSVQQVGNYAVNPELDQQAAEQTSQAATDYQNKLRSDKGIAPLPDESSPSGASGSWDNASTTPSDNIANDDDAAKIKAGIEALGETSDDGDSESGPVNQAAKQNIADQQAQNQNNPPMPASVEDQQAPQASAPIQTSKSLDSQLAQNTVDIQNNQKALADNDAKFEAALSSKAIDPNRIYKNQTTGQSIGHAIGMFLGGIGGALTHQENPAVKYMNDAINRDIDAQKTDQSNSMNLWKVHNDTLHSAQAATLQTRNNYLSDAKTKLEEQMGSLPGPMAQQKAQLLGSQIDQEMAMNRFKLAAFQGASNPGDAQGSEQAHVSRLNQLQQIAPELYKDAESKYIPGVGIARVPVAEKDREALTSWDSLENKLNQAQQFANKTGTTIPFTEKNQQANDLQSGIQLEIGNLLGLKRINEYEAKKYEQMGQNPGQFRSGIASQSFQDLKNEIAKKRAAQLSSLGVTPFANSRVNQDGSMAPLVNGQDGKQYYRKGNYMVPVGQ